MNLKMMLAGAPAGDLENSTLELLGIREAFKSHEKGELVKITYLPRSTTKDVLYELRNFSFHIFHFAGHSQKGKNLVFEDQHGNTTGLAQLFKHQKELMLVFLNGCSTNLQVEYFLQAGVKAIIATTLDIGDEQAKDFAIEFYKGLSDGMTIQTAFEYAAGVANFTSRTGVNRRNKKEVDEHIRLVPRTLNLEQNIHNSSPISNWGLYLHANNKEKVLNWKIDLPIPKISNPKTRQKISIKRWWLIGIIPLLYVINLFWNPFNQLFQAPSINKTICEDAYLWDFTKADRTRNSFTMEITKEFQEALSSLGCEMVDRSDFIAIQNELEDDQIINSLEALSWNKRRQIESALPTDKIIFGTILNQRDGTIEFELSIQENSAHNWNEIRKKTIILKQSQYIKNRKELIRRYLQELLEDEDY